MQGKPCTTLQARSLGSRGVWTSGIFEDGLRAFGTLADPPGYQPVLVRGSRVLRFGFKIGYVTRYVSSTGGPGKFVFFLFFVWGLKASERGPTCQYVYRAPPMLCYVCYVMPEGWE